MRSRLVILSLVSVFASAQQSPPEPFIKIELPGKFSRREAGERQAVKDSLYELKDLESETTVTVGGTPKKIRVSYAVDEATLGTFYITSEYRVDQTHKLGFANPTYKYYLAKFGSKSSAKKTLARWVEDGLDGTLYSVEERDDYYFIYKLVTSDEDYKLARADVVRKSGLSQIAGVNEGAYVNFYPVVKVEGSTKTQLRPGIDLNSRLNLYRFRLNESEFEGLCDKKSCQMIDPVELACLKWQRDELAQALNEDQELREILLDQKKINVDHIGIALNRNKHPEIPVEHDFVDFNPRIHISGDRGLRVAADYIHQVTLEADRSNFSQALEANCIPQTKKVLLISLQTELAEQVAPDVADAKHKQAVEDFKQGNALIH